MRNTLLFPLILVFSAVTANGQGKKDQRRYNHQTSAGEIKFGLHIFDEYGVFGEYKFTDQIGLQSGLLWDYRSRISKAVLCGEEYAYTLSYLCSPIIFRYYVGEKKHFCWFIGPKIYYLLGGNRMGINNSLNINAIAEPRQRPSKYDVSIDVGFDYETVSGFIWGLMIYSQGLINVVKEPKPFKNYGVPFLRLGYNFGKLMQ